MKKTRLLIGILAVLVIAAVIQRILADSDEIPLPPVHSAAELAATPEADLEAVVGNDIAIRILTRGTTPGQWRKTLNIPAQNLWILRMVEGGITNDGLQTFCANQARMPEEPGLADAADACQALGLEVPAGLFRELAQNPEPRTWTRLQAILKEPAVHARRAAYTRTHLAELAQPIVAK